MNFKLIKFGLLVYITAVAIGIGYVYLKSKNIIPSRVKLENIDYQNSEIKKGISLVKIEKHGNRYVMKVVEFYINTKVKTTLPFKDFKFKKGKLFYKRKIGLTGEILPIYIEIELPKKKFTAFSKTEIGNLREDNIKDFINKDNFIIQDFRTFVFAKNRKNRCGILNIEREKEVYTIVCNIDKDFKSLNRLEGLYLVATNTAVKLPFNFSFNRKFSNNERLLLRKYIKYLVIADTFLNTYVKNKIKLDFERTANIILSPYGKHINEIDFNTK